VNEWLRPSQKNAMLDGSQSIRTPSSSARAAISRSLVKRWW
jgi:hypothetical protein